MAQTTTNLGKIHVFPSETLYNQFKDIIADNDLALLKDDGAYIVAALLEQNGYVKFSNGLILQWGYVMKSSTDVAFPCSFLSQVFSVQLCVKVHDSSTNFVNCRNSTLNGFTVGITNPHTSYDAMDGFYWIAIGI